MGSLFLLLISFQLGIKHGSLFGCFLDAVHDGFPFYRITYLIYFIFLYVSYIYIYVLIVLHSTKYNDIIRSTYRKPIIIHLQLNEFQIPFICFSKGHVYQAAAIIR